MISRILMTSVTATRTLLMAAGTAALLIAPMRRVSAQAVPEVRRGFEFLVSSGALMPTGAQRDAIKRGNLTAAQLSYVVRPNLAVTATVGWARSRDIASVESHKLDVFNYDFGVEGRANRWMMSDAIFVTPFAGVGAGGRMYNYRDRDIDATHNLAAYGSTGAELGYRRVRLRIEARDYLSGFKPLVGEGEAVRRNDVAVLFGFRITGIGK